MNEFRLEDEKVLINVPYAEAYISASLFTDTKSTMSKIYGDGIITFGMFYMRFFKSEEEADEKRDSVPLETFQYPNPIFTCPTEYEKKFITLKGIEEECYILKYYKDDIMMESQTVKNILNCEAYLNALIKAKIPDSIDYQDIFLNWYKNFKMNGFHPGTKAVILQLIIAESARYTEDLTVPFRKYAAKHKDLKTSDFKLVNMNTIAANSSVFAAIGFERVKEKLATSITMSKNDVEQSISPLEKVILY